MPAPPTRLVTSPIFILSSIRSGSTLLRCVLDTHSQIHAPHELHLADLGVEAAQPSLNGLASLGLDPSDLKARMWDSILHHVLNNSGKLHVVDKTPGNLLHWRELAAMWPRARFLFLVRHPAHILTSVIDYRRDDFAESVWLVTTYLRHLVEAMGSLPGLTVRYEELTANPADTTAGICDYLDVPWEPEMCDYGRRDHGPYVLGLGDFGTKIRSGHIQDEKPTSDLGELTPELRELGAELGYGETP
jgi:hypothetical protein